MIPSWEKEKNKRSLTSSREKKNGQGIKPTLFEFPEALVIHCMEDMFFS